MTEIALDFEWSRDGAGYELVAEVPPQVPRKVLVDHPIFGKIETETSLLAQAKTPARIVPLGGASIVYRPLAKEKGLFRAFATTVRDPNTLLLFIRKFGPLTPAGHTELGEEVDPALKSATLMKEILLAYGEGRKADAAKAIGKGIRLARVDASLVVDPRTKMPKVQLGVTSLLHGLWIQMGQFIAGGRAVRSCLQCGGAFVVGAGTGRRLVAKFCSDEHRITYNSLARTRS